MLIFIIIIIRKIGSKDTKNGFVNTVREKHVKIVQILQEHDKIKKCRNESGKEGKDKVRRGICLALFLGRIFPLKKAVIFLDFSLSQAYIC